MHSASLAYEDGVVFMSLRVLLSKCLLHGDENSLLAPQLAQEKHGFTLSKQQHM